MSFALKTDRLQSAPIQQELDSTLFDTWTPSGAYPNQTVLTRFTSAMAPHSFLSILIISSSATPADTTSSAEDYLIFKKYRDRWRTERNPFSSSEDEITSSAAYQGIIGMGKAAIPLIISELKKEQPEPDFWFRALSTITRKNPVPLTARGNLKEMAKAWVDWAEDNRFADARTY